MIKKEELDGESFIIAEVGQNHQGDLDLARKYIKEFAEAGVDAVKFQTRDNKFLFSKDAYSKPYNSENAFATTYGLHREALELDKEVLPILISDCHKYGVKFMSTPFDEPSLDYLCEIGVDIIKIASFDLGNLPFIERIARKGIPVVMSVGGGKIEQIRDSVRILTKYLDEVAVLHCVSEYPCDVSRLGLDNIEILIEEFPECLIGLSDHFNGIVTGPVAYMKGARIFEKHVTLNRSWKGTDHSFALERHGCRNFVRDIRRVPLMMSPKNESELGEEFVFQKLGKSIVAFQDINVGESLTLENLSGKIFDNIYINVRDSNKVIGMSVKRKICAGEAIKHEDLEGIDSSNG
jgi:N-acetylneuraminate synthase/sialic acid synthase